MDYIAKAEETHQFDQIEAEQKKTIVINTMDDLLEGLKQLIYSDDFIKFHRYYNDETFFFTITRIGYEEALKLEIDGDEYNIIHEPLEEKKCCEIINKWFQQKQTNETEYESHFKNV